MAELGDVLGKNKKDSYNFIKVEIDGLCGFHDGSEICYWALDHVLIDEQKKKIIAICVKNHEVEIPWGVIQSG